MPWLLEALLFLLPFLGFALWRRFNPDVELGPKLTALVAIGAVCTVAGALWYGLSRSMDRGTTYVPPRWEDGHIVPGHSEPRR